MITKEQAQMLIADFIDWHAQNKNKIIGQYVTKAHIVEYVQRNDFIPAESSGEERTGDVSSKLSKLIEVYKNEATLYRNSATKLLKNGNREMCIMHAIRDEVLMACVRDINTILDGGDIDDQLITVNQ